MPPPCVGGYTAAPRDSGDDARQVIARELFSGGWNGKDELFYQYLFLDLDAYD